MKILRAVSRGREAASPKIDFLSIFVALIWGLAGLFVAINAPSAPAIALFIPVGFPLSIVLLAIAGGTGLGLTGTVLLFAVPWQNTLVGYFAAKLLRKHWKRPVFRRIFLGVTAVLVFLYIIFITPLIIALSVDKPLVLQLTLGKLYRMQLNAVPAELDAATYYRRANEALAETGFGEFPGAAGIPPKSPWKAEDHPELSKWINDNQDVMELIEQGTQKEFCKGYIGEVVDQSIYPPIERFDPKLMGAVITDLSLSLGEDGVSKSLPALNRIIRLLGHFYQRDTLIASIVAYVNESSSLHPLLRDVLLSDSLVEEFCETLIDRMIWLDLIAEKAFRYRLLYELRLSGLWIDPAYSYSLFIKPASLQPGWEAAAMVNIIRLRWNTFFLPMGETLALYDLWLDSLERVFFTPLYSPEYDALKKDLETIETRIREDRFIGDTLPRYDSLMEIDLKGGAERRLTILLAALKLYRVKNGIYPEKTEQLVPDYLPFLPKDPYSDKPWIYRKEDGRITIASNKGEGTEISINFPEKGRPFILLPIKRKLISN